MLQSQVGIWVRLLDVCLSHIVLLSIYIYIYILIIYTVYLYIYIEIGVAVKVTVFFVCFYGFIHDWGYKTM